MASAIGVSRSLRGRRIALLMHDSMLDLENGKTGLPMLRHSDLDIVAVIDRQTAGRDLAEVMRLPAVRQVPIVGSVDNAQAFAPDTLVVGFAPLGGKLPSFCRIEVATALRAGMSIASGLHSSLANDAEFAALVGAGQWIWDVRREPQGLTSGSGAAAKLACRRVLLIGTDMAVGKLTAALALNAAAARRGIKSGLVATGQTGIMITGAGIPLDAIRVDFAAGAVEAEIVRESVGRDLLWIEGQGSLINPASTATLPLMRGSQPTSMILVHRCGVDHLIDFPERRIPPLADVIRLNEAVASAAGMFGSPRVVGVALNTWRLAPDAAHRVTHEIESATGLPTADVVRNGPDRILEAVLQS
jgi:uncharacterized NAD-dependent epimerase/dehydratase family protein